LSLFNEYKRSLKMVAVEEPLDLYLHRIISFMFVKLIYPLPITPNQISVAAMFMGVISGIFFSFGTRQMNIYAALFYALYYLLDLSDGQVARLKKNGTPLGRVIDGISDYVTHLAVFIGLGLGLGTNTDLPISAWGLVSVTLACLLFHVIVSDYYRNRFMEYALGGVSLYGDDLAELKVEYQKASKTGGQRVSRIILALYLKYLALQKLILPTTDAQDVEKRFDVPTFLERNRIPIRLWSLMGSSLHITLLIVFSLMNQITWYFYSILGVINCYVLIMLAMQVLVDRKTPRNQSP